jgi:hypothetical protein
VLSQREAVAGQQILSAASAVAIAQIRVRTQIDIEIQEAPENQESKGALHQASFEFCP